MRENIPIRHHYIPQFILRNFLNENRKLYYIKKENNEIIEDITANIFMEKNLNKDEINNKENPMWIEEELSFIENEIAPIMKKINTDDEILLSTEIVYKLRIFLFIMIFRNKYIRDQFLNMSDKDIETYKQFQNFDNNIDLWKKNLAAMTSCSDIIDIAKNDNINILIKNLIIDNYKNYYITVIETRGNKNFIISDVYPTLYFKKVNNINLLACLFYPISPIRMIILNYFNNDKLFKNDELLSKNLCYSPQYDKINKKLKFVAKKIYEKDVKKINDIIFNNAIEGIVKIKI